MNANQKAAIKMMESIMAENGCELASIIGNLLSILQGSCSKYCQERSDFQEIHTGTLSLACHRPAKEARKMWPVNSGLP